MTTRSLVMLVAASSLFTLPRFAQAYSQGSPSEHTGGFGEPSCTACHSGSGQGRVSVIVPQPYLSGATYQITVTIFDQNARRWGFQLSTRTPSGAQAGTLTAGGEG